MTPVPCPTFVERARPPEIDGGETDPDAVTETALRTGYSPFRPDWERLREFEPDGPDCG